MTRAVIIVLAAVLFAGALFGYDQGVIAGALQGIRKAFLLNHLLVEVVTSWITLGALFGSLGGGELADRIGRRNTLLIAGSIFTLGALVEALSPDTAVLVGGRLIVGLGVGIAAVAAPLYAAELAPAALRGRFVSAYQLAIAAGIFLAYLVDGLLTRDGAWRWMLAASCVPGGLLLLAAAFAPESPRWLISKARQFDAGNALHEIDPDADIDAQIKVFATAAQADPGRTSWGEVFHKQWRRPLMIGIGLAIFQQITGINAIIYYADQIFATAGFVSRSSEATLTTWCIGGVNVVATLVAVMFVDRLGRRKLLLYGLVGMAISMIVVGGAFAAMNPGSARPPANSITGLGGLTLLALMAFIICFGFSVGPVVWTVINEIFPGHIRGRGVAVATAVNWGAAFLVSQGFLSLIDMVGNAFSFWIFALACMLGWLWVYRSVPETKGLSLEQIQALWRR